MKLPKLFLIGMIILFIYLEQILSVYWRHKLDHKVSIAKREGIFPSSS